MATLYTAFPRHDENGNDISAAEAAERTKTVFKALNLVLGVQAFSFTVEEVEANVLEPSHIIQIELTDIDGSKDLVA